MPLPHDPEYTAQHYDRYAEQEWDRHDATWAARTSFAIHCRYLSDFVASGYSVLDVGAGPGRFTIELAKLGARVQVAELSPVQLQLNATRVREAGWEHAVAGRVLADICDLSMFTDGGFETVIAFGGPLSYAMDQADRALRELCRVTRPGGHVLLSVMSCAGAIRAFLPQLLDEGRRFGLDHGDNIVRTGDLARATNNGHECHMYRWSELARLLDGHGEIVGASAANFITARDDEALDAASDTERERILHWEMELCREPGALDGGTHILAVLKTPEH
jgi:SAM-dependent methyltransferase